MPRTKRRTEGQRQTDAHKEYHRLKDIRTAEYAAQIKADPNARARIVADILNAAERPMMEIAEARQLLGSDGKYYGICGFPVGVRFVADTPESVKVIGYVWRDRDGTTYGTVAPTRETLQAQHAAGVARDRAEFLSALESSTDQRVAEQAAYWLDPNRR